jgi:non-ribosomal peptide synthetase component E (peptide arylation enzyme)
MAKKKPRSRKKVPTHIERVQKYLARCPDASAERIADTLNLTLQQVYGIINSLRKTNRLPDGCIYAVKKGAADSFTTADVLTVKKIGIAKTKAILKLLEQL